MEYFEVTDRQHFSSGQVVEAIAQVLEKHQVTYRSEKARYGFCLCGVKTTRAGAYVHVAMKIMPIIRKFYIQRVPCHYCAEMSQTWDHIVPKARGGIDAAWNVVPCCFEHNQEKGDKMTTCGCIKCTRSIQTHLDAGIDIYKEEE